MPKAPASKFSSRHARQTPRAHHHNRGAPDEPQATVNKTKTRLRNVRRLLDKTEGSLPADKRQALEREQASLSHELRRRQDKAARKAMISKYHMVRFFERRKAERLLKKARKAGVDSDDVHRRTVDLNYTQYFPLSAPYVSLYPKEQGPDDAPNRVSPLWAEVERATEAGTLDALRDRPPARDASSSHQAAAAAGFKTGKGGASRVQKQPGGTTAGNRIRKTAGTRRDSSLRDDDTSEVQNGERGRDRDDDDKSDADEDGGDDDDDGRGLAFFE